MRKQFLFCILLFLMVIVSVTVTSSSAVTRSGVGLRVGDTARYHVHGNLVSLACDRMRLRVVDISDSVVKIEVNYYLNGGGPLWSTENITGDIYTGEAKIWDYLVAPGLNPGEPVYSGATILINETTTRTYNTMVRVVNHLLPYRTSGGAYVEMYWDRNTGLMAETSYWLSLPNRTESTQGDSVIVFPSVTTTLISTTAWSEGSTNYDYTSPLAIIGAALTLLGAITFTVLVADRRRQHFQ